MKILIADDHEVFRDGLWLIASQAFPEAGLLEARNWHDVKEALARHHDILVVAASMDLHGQDLPEAVAELSALPAPVATIVFGDHISLEDAKKLVQAGARAIIAKSTPRHLIVAALNMVLAGGIYIPDNVLAQALTGNNRVTAPARFNLPGPTFAGVGSLPHKSAPASILTASMINKLTRRQRDIASLLAEGKSNSIIASELGIAEGTVRIHVSAVLKALDVNSRSQVAAMAARGDIVTQD